MQLCSNMLIDATATCYIFHLYTIYYILYTIHGLQVIAYLISYSTCVCGIKDTVLHMCIHIHTCSYICNMIGGILMYHVVT